MIRSLSFSVACLAVLFLSTIRAGEANDLKIIAAFGEPYGPIPVLKKDGAGVVIRMPRSWSLTRASRTPRRMPTPRKSWKAKWQSS